MREVAVHQGIYMGYEGYNDVKVIYGSASEYAPVIVSDFSSTPGITSTYEITIDQSTFKNLYIQGISGEITWRGRFLWKLCELLL